MEKIIVLCSSICLSRNFVDGMLINCALKYFVYFSLFHKDNRILSRKKYCYLPTITLALIACFVTDWSKFIIQNVLALWTALHTSVVLVTTVWLGV